MKKKSQQSIELIKADKEQSNGKVNVVTINEAPFNFVEKDDEIMITIGTEVLKKCETMEEAVKYVETKPWDLILNATAIYVEYINKIKEERRTENESM